MEFSGLVGSVTGNNLFDFWKTSREQTSASGQQLLLLLLLFFFFMNGNTELAQCALSRVCIHKKRKR